MKLRERADGKRERVNRAERDRGLQPHPERGVTRGLSAEERQGFDFEESVRAKQPFHEHVDQAVAQVATRQAVVTGNERGVQSKRREG